jgi:uncharacterized damage-inducible protein DinB
MTSTLLEESLAGWHYTRDGVIAELQNIPADAYGFRPAAGMRTVAELAWHIVESGLMMAGELSRDDGDFTRQAPGAFLKEYSGSVDRVMEKGAVIRLLRESHAAGDTRIREAGAVHMMASIVQFDGTSATRLSWMSHGVAHEEYHRGQLALYARLMGLEPALTQRMRAS